MSENTENKNRIQDEDLADVAGGVSSWKDVTEVTKWCIACDYWRKFRRNPQGVWVCEECGGTEVKRF